MVEKMMSIDRFNAIGEKQIEGKSVFVDQNSNGIEPV